MYKLFIVEDEWFTRNALVNEVTWAEAGCEVVGEAGDGLSAVAHIAAAKPDIVISDIKMDGMDGIALCQKIREDFPEIRFIIITGHGEFAYAQTALKLGVKDFILKPTQPDELLAAVRKAAAEIELEAQKRQEFARLQGTIEANIPALREKFLLELLTEEGVHPEEIRERMLFLKIQSGAFHTVCMEIDDYGQFIKNNAEKERQLKKLVIKRIAQQLIDQYQGGHILNKEFNLFVMVVYQAPQCDIFEIAEAIQTEVFAYLSLDISLGVSQPCQDFSHYRRSYQQAHEALQHKFYLGEKTIAAYEDIHDGSQRISSQTIFEKALIMNCLKIGDGAGAVAQLCLDLQQVESQMAQSVAQIRNAAMELAVLIQGVLLDRRLEPHQGAHQNFYEAIAQCNTLAEIQTFLEDAIRRTALLIQNENCSKNCAAVEKIVAYLKANYASNIGLDDLAQLVYLNPKYVCRLIKKETGQNFLDILTEIRIEKAKELMRDVGYKTYEIARLVGINDSRYFSQMFKKIAGMTPTEYREGSRGREVVNLTNKM